MSIYEMALKKVEREIYCINEDYKKIYDYEIVDHIMKRIKSPQSIIDKMKKKNYELNYKELIENINDIAGIRIICKLRKDVYDIRDLIEESEEFKIINEKDYIKHPKKSGYTSYHLIVEVPVEFENTTIFVKVEIQIRTLAMDFWATIEHHTKYKSKNKISKRNAKKLVTYAKIINKLDEKMLDLLENK